MDARVSEELSVPLRLHGSLLALAGRIDDSALGTCRELIARSRLDEAADLLAGTLEAGRIPVLAAEAHALAEVLTQVRSDAALADRLAIADDTGDDISVAHDFTGADDPAYGVEAALDRVLGVLPDLRAVFAVWRTSPAGSVPGPMPQRVVLVEVGPEASAPVTAYRVQAALARAGIRASVEVAGARFDWPEYHRAALAAAVPVWRQQASRSSARELPAAQAQQSDGIEARQARAQHGQAQANAQEPQAQRAQAQAQRTQDQAQRTQAQAAGAGEEPHHYRSQHYQPRHHQAQHPETQHPEAQHPEAQPESRAPVSAPPAASAPPAVARAAEAERTVVAAPVQPPVAREPVEAQAAPLPQADPDRGGVEVVSEIHPRWWELDAESAEPAESAASGDDREAVSGHAGYGAPDPDSEPTVVRRPVAPQAVPDEPARRSEEAVRDQAGHDQAGHDQAGHDQAGHGEPGQEQAGHHQAGYDRAGEQVFAEPPPGDGPTTVPDLSDRDRFLLAQLHAELAKRERAAGENAAGAAAPVNGSNWAKESRWAEG